MRSIRVRRVTERPRRRPSNEDAEICWDVSRRPRRLWSGETAVVGRGCGCRTEHRTQQRLSDGAGDEMGQTSGGVPRALSDYVGCPLSSLPALPQAFSPCSRADFLDRGAGGGSGVTAGSVGSLFCRATEFRLAFRPRARIIAALCQMHLILLRVPLRRN